MKRILAEPTEMVRAMKAALEPMADGERARAMRAYMRDQFGFLGVPATPFRAAIRPVLRRHKPADTANLLEAARELFSMNEREYHHAAVELLMANEAILAAKDLGEVLEIVQTRAWWDTVDALAANVVGAVVRRERKAGGRAMDRAVRSPNMWVRRVAMLHQLAWRGETDVKRLFAYAEGLAGEKEFFIRKAVGWALRQYARHDAGAVREFVEERKGVLSGLTYREAMKHL